MHRILYLSGFVVCLFVSVTAIAKRNEWFLAQEEGAREYIVEDPLGNVLNFSCETAFNASSPNLIGERILYLYIGTQSYDSSNQIIMLSTGEKAITLARNLAGEMDSGMPSGVVHKTAKLMSLMFLWLERRLSPLRC